MKDGKCSVLRGFYLRGRNRFTKQGWMVDAERTHLLAPLPATHVGLIFFTVSGSCEFWHWVSPWHFAQASLLASFVALEPGQEHFAQGRIFNPKRWFHLFFLKKAKFFLFMNNWPGRKREDIHFLRNFLSRWTRGSFLFLKNDVLGQINHAWGPAIHQQRGLNTFFKEGNNVINLIDRNQRRRKMRHFHFPKDQWGFSRTYTGGKTQSGNLTGGCWRRTRMVTDSESSFLRLCNFVTLSLCQPPFLQFPYKV